MGNLKFLFVFLLLQLISYIDVECAQIKCKIGVERYHNGDCVRCTCSKGNGLRISQVGQSQTWPKKLAKEKNITTTTNLRIAQNDIFLCEQMLSGDVTMCPPCSPCSAGEFSGPETGHLCVNCSISCEIQNRVIVRQCDGEKDVICGQCLQG